MQGHRPPMEGPAVSYRYQGNPVVLKQDMARVAVELDDETQRLKIRANRVIRNLSGVVLPEDTHKDYIGSRFILEWSNDVPTAPTFSFVPQPRSATAREDAVARWNARAQNLRAQPGVKAVWPVYVYPPTGINLFCPGEVTVKLNGGVTSATLAREVSALGLEIESVNPGMRHIVTLRQTDPNRGEPFSLAQGLSERKGLIAWASPNFTQRYRLASNWVPWPYTDPSDAYQGTDPLYTQQWNLHGEGVGEYPKGANFQDMHGVLSHAQWPTEAQDPSPTESVGDVWWHDDQWQIWRPPTLAIIDTGCDYSHEDLVLNTWHNWGEYQNELDPWDELDNDFNGYTDDLIGWDFVEGDWDPSGLDGHGTSCAGIACARGYNSIGIRGGAPFYAHTALRVANNNGVFVSDARLGEALTYAGRMCTAASCSWGGGAPAEAIHEGILYCLTFGNGGHGVFAEPYIEDGWFPQRRGAGALVFFSAGNWTDNELAYPAADPWAISVGATLRTDIRSDYSNFSGPAARLDVAAPGGSLAGDITTTDISGAEGYSAGNYFNGFNGTSAAAPLAAAAGYLASFVNRRSFPYEFAYTVLRPYLFENWPGDSFGDNVDPRRYTAGEITQAILHGCDKIDPYYAMYDDFGFSLQYGWGRINAHNILVGVSQNPDDVYEVDGINDDDVRYTKPKYLRPGVHKRLLARDTDYYLVSLEAYSSARIVMTYPRWVWGRANKWNNRYWSGELDKDGKIRGKYGAYEDNTTSPRLKLTTWPELDPWNPSRHTPGQRYLANGAPKHPLPVVINVSNGGDMNRLEDIVECYMRRDWWDNARENKNYNESAPPRPYVGDDVAYYLKVARVPQYTDNHFPGKFRRAFGIEKFYTPIVEYSLQFDYCPPSNWGTYYDSDFPPPDKRSADHSPLFRYTYPPLQEQHYKALHSTTPARAYIYLPTIDHLEHFNCMQTYNNALGNMWTTLWESFPNVAAEGGGAGDDDSGEIWNFQAHRRDNFHIEDRGHETPFNDYWVGLHYSITTNTAQGKPLEFTVPSSGPHKNELGYANAPPNPPDRPFINYYPFEHWTSANKLTKKYLLRLDAKEGARVTVAQQEFTIPILIDVWDERMREFAWELNVGPDMFTGKRTETITLEPQWRATSYTLEIGYFNYYGYAIPPGIDIRYQLAVDRYHQGMKHPEFEPVLDAPDLVVKDFWFTSGWTSTQTVTMLNLTVKNEGTTSATKTYVNIEFPPPSGLVFEDIVTTPIGPVDLGSLGAGKEVSVPDYVLYYGMNEGWYTAKLTVDAPRAEDELDETNNERIVEFEILPRFYDLAVESCWFWPEQPREGQHMWLGFNTRNSGTVDSTPTSFTIEMEGVGASEGTLPPIPPWGIAETQDAFDAAIGPTQMGPHLLTIDVATSPIERNFNDNHYQRTITVLPTRPDLTIVSHSISPRQPNDGVNTHVRLLVKNVGLLPTTLHSVAGLVNQGGTPVGPAMTVNPLAAGAQQAVDINLGRLAAGPYNLTGVADLNGSIAEGYENNNTRPVNFTVNALGVEGPWQLYE